MPGLRKTEISPDENLCSDSVTAHEIPNRILTETRNTCEIKTFVLIKNTPQNPPADYKITAPIHPIKGCTMPSPRPGWALPCAGRSTSAGLGVSVPRGEHEATRGQAGRGEGRARVAVM